MAAPPAHRPGLTAMWDSFQQEMLAALGHVVYRPAGADSEPDPVVTKVAGDLEAVAAPAQAPRGNGAVPPSLLRALARAAAVAPAQLPALPALPRLRSAAGKRALWPALRALRRSRGG